MDFDYAQYAYQIDETEPEGDSGGPKLRDVTRLFEEAASQMEPGEFIFLQGFTLQDAMSACEIGEPRLDTGLMTDSDSPQKPPFNPLAPLLPDEVCWIVDRAFAYESVWHQGNLLCHSVLTLQYVHHLAALDPETSVSNRLRTLASLPSSPSTRPKTQAKTNLNLVTLVLRSAIMGLLKTCDLAWRQMHKGDVQDTEDWQSDKCEVSFLEGTPVPYVLKTLDEAAMWLLATSEVEEYWKNALRARLLLRKTLIEIVSTDVFKSPTQFQSLLNAARGYLTQIRAHPSLAPPSSSVAHLAFDPYIVRKLNTFVPLKIIIPPSAVETWERVEEGLVKGWEEVGRLAVVQNIKSWNIVGNLRNWKQPELALQTPYIRAFIQSTFFDGFLILNQFTLAWMISQFFFENIGVSYPVISHTLKAHWTGTTDVVPLLKLERCLYKLITPQVRSNWYNPPRKRRHLMKSVLEWHVLYDELVKITDRIDMTTIPETSVIPHLPKLALLERLAAIREIVLSGFQLELYAAEEKAFAYWYCAVVCKAHVECLASGIMETMPKGSAAYKEALFERDFLCALQMMCRASFIVTMPLMTFSWTRMKPNFYRRYKWAFRPEYDDIDEPVVVAQPDLHEFSVACVEAVQDEQLSPARWFEVAAEIMRTMREEGVVGGWANAWEGERMEFVRKLEEQCRDLAAGVPNSMEEMDKFEAKTMLRWDPRVQPWLPFIV